MYSLNKLKHHLPTGQLNQLTVEFFSLTHSLTTHSLFLSEICFGYFWKAIETYTCIHIKAWLDITLVKTSNVYSPLGQFIKSIFTEFNFWLNMYSFWAQKAFSWCCRSLFCLFFFFSKSVFIQAFIHAFVIFHLLSLLCLTTYCSLSLTLSRSHSLSILCIFLFALFLLAYFFFFFPLFHHIRTCTCRVDVYMSLQMFVTRKRNLA